MSEFPTGSSPTLPLFVTSLGRYSGAYEGQSLLSSATLAAYNWPAQNRAVYIPLTIPWAFPVMRVFWVQGSVAGGNNDFGIYTLDGAKIFSTGATAQSGTNVPQYVTVGTPFLLGAGSYYFALTYDNATLTTRTFGLSGVAEAQGKIAGLLQQESVGVLPSTATFAAWTSTGLPICGITRTASGF